MRSGGETVGRQRSGQPMPHADLTTSAACLAIPYSFVSASPRECRDSSTARNVSRRRRGSGARSAADRRTAARSTGYPDRRRSSRVAAPNGAPGARAGHDARLHRRDHRTGRRPRGPVPAADPAGGRALLAGAAGWLSGRTTQHVGGLVAVVVVVTAIAVVASLMSNAGFAGLQLLLMTTVSSGRPFPGPGWQPGLLTRRGPPGTRRPGRRGP